ncbi:MAG: (Fe-S)-binding protein [Thermoleophilia bacterium]
MSNVADIELPGLDCGLCGYPSCEIMAAQLEAKPELIKRCIPLSADSLGVSASPSAAPFARAGALCSASGAGTCQDSLGGSCASCGAATVTGTAGSLPMADASAEWTDVLGREFDFVLDHFPEEVGPREQVIPHNPMITRELDLQPGDVLIGRPLGISCGCPVTHCGIVQSVDKKTGTVVWCVTGPLHPRQHGFKDVGYYSAQAYEGLITKARLEVEIGRRYWFQPRMCMMQWRHSGLVNFINRGPDGLQVRVEGLWIG